ncbi:NAD(P)-dependent oxidoreductase [Microvirga sp. GCM10011540]|uniref:NAD(P)-dependent oxidoreductase n=1 Tax=Microvirga sp. GCM10011540 TaxID=3317338 RepID=UPI00360C5CCD
MKIGIAGLGRMGTAIAERLMEVGHDLIVWNRSPEKTRHLTAQGAYAAASASEVGEKSDAIITILTDAAAIDSIYRSPAGLLAADLEGKLVIDMSTVQPETERRLAEDVRKSGATFVECPVGGTTGPARAGKLIGLMGGAPDDVARARPILEQLCRRLEHVGPVGAGASMKLAINLPLLVFYQALGEAYSLCRHLGNDAEAVMDLFSDTSGGANVLKVRGPAIARALTGEEFIPPTFDVNSIRKDLRTMLDEARTQGIDLPLVERTLAIYDEAGRSGWGERDGTSLPAYWANRHGS